MRLCRSLIAGATALLLSVPAYATTIPSVASGEAADREAALTSALRHAIEQVVGMSVNTSTYVSNLKSIQDKIYTGATGYIESYEVVDEQRTPTGYRVTVSAKVAKEKLASAVAPIVGDGAIKLDGKLALDNLKVGLENQKDAERTLKALLDELSGPALSITFDVPRAEMSTADPNTVIVSLDNFNIEVNEEWYERYRGFCMRIAGTSVADEVFKHGLRYAYNRENEFVVELLNDRNEVLIKPKLFFWAHVNPDNYQALFPKKGLPVVPPALQGRETSVRFSVPTGVFKRVAKIQVRPPRMNNWPTAL